MKFWDKLNKNVLILALVYLVGISAICTCRFTFNIWISIFIFPPCLIYFNRKTNPKIGLPLLYVGMVFGWSISLFNLLVTSAGWGWAILANILYATIYFIPFILDKLVFNKFFNNNILVCLLFTLTWITIDFITSFLPFGNGFSITYALCQILNMVGIISLIGINGLTFIIMFFNITLTTGLINKKNYWKPMLISSSMLLFAVLYGGIYSSINVSQTNNIKIMTGYSTNDAYNTNSGHSERTHWTITANKEYLQKDINLAKQAKVDLLAYPEEAFWIWENELEEFKNECISQCQTNNLYGVIGICISNNNASKDSEITWFKNQSWLISNTGEIKIYQKVHPVFMDEDGMIKGDGSVVYLDTKWGRISTAICLDLEYETYMTRFGRANIDLLISPNWDWNGIQPNHTISNGYRAVENGFNMLRVTEGGYSAAIDNHGNVIYQYFTEFDGKDKNVNHVFSMSTKKAWTLYPYLAYFIDYLYPLSLAGLITYFSIDKFKKNSKNSINK